MQPFYLGISRKLIAESVGIIVAKGRSRRHHTETLAARKDVMMKDNFTIFSAVASHACMADRQGGNEAPGHPMALRFTYRPHRFRISVKPGRKRAAFRARSGGGYNNKN